MEYGTPGLDVRVRDGLKTRSLVLYTSNPSNINAQFLKVLYFNSDTSPESDCLIISYSLDYSFVAYILQGRVVSQYSRISLIRNLLDRGKMPHHRDLRTL